MNWIMETQKLANWQIVGAVYLLLAIGWHISRIYITQFINDDKARTLVERKNSPKAWRKLLFWLVIVPSAASTFLIATEIFIALSKALKDYSLGEIPLLLQIIAWSFIPTILIIFLIARKKRSYTNEEE